MSEKNEREFQCTNCKSKVTVTIPEQAIVNTKQVSMIVMVHELMDRCPKCGQKYVFEMAGGKISFGWKPFDEHAEEDPNVIIPPTQILA